MDHQIADKIDRIAETATATKVNVQHLQVQVQDLSEKLDDLRRWQTEVRASMKITAGIASVVGGITGWAVNIIFL